MHELVNTLLEASLSFYVSKNNSDLELILDYKKQQSISELKYRGMQSSSL